MHDDLDGGTGTAGNVGTVEVTDPDASTVDASRRSDRAAPTDPADPTDPDGRGRPRHFWWHAAALAVVLLALVPLFDSEAPAFPDEGLYSAQVDHLSNGSWARERPATDLDSDGQRSALSEETHVGTSSIPYSRRPVYPLALVPFYAVLGSAGLLVVSALGTWAASVGAALLAGRLRSRFVLPTLWLVGVGSPLLFGAYIVVGHTIAAALTAFLVLSLAHAVDDRRSAWLVAAAACIVPLVLVRSEGAVVVAATALVVTALSVTFKPRLRVDLRTAAIGVGVGVLGAAAYLLDSRLAPWLVGRGAESTGAAVTRRNPLSAAWVSLLRPWEGIGVQAKASTVLVMVALPLAALLLKVLPRRTLLPLALVVLAAGAALVRQLEPVNLMSGLLPAFPVVGFVVLLRRKDLQDHLVARMLGISAVTIVVLALTLYEVGGAAEWGGRFFYVLVPLLGVLAVLGMDVGRQLLSRTEARVAAVSIVVVVASLSVLGLRANLALRDRNSTVVVESVRFADRAVGGRDPLVVTVGTRGSGMARYFWRPVVDGSQVVDAVDLLNLGPLLQRIPLTGRPGAVMVTNAQESILALVADPWLEESGWEVLGSEQLGDTQFRAILVGPSGGVRPSD